jgi:GAF domain-containing protein
VTITTGEALTIDDVQTVPVFASNPLVRADRDLHAFAAVPLRTHDGHVIGTLCVFDHRTRAFSEEELDDLGQLAAMTMRELELRLAGRRVLFER